ncbi:Phytocyanin domain-containing protein [Psidium guajava]|nr:Phytocyanin domain-containing protein [Psidium guajava]
MHRTPLPVQLDPPKSSGSHKSALFDSFSLGNRELSYPPPSATTIRKSPFPASSISSIPFSSKLSFLLPLDGIPKRNTSFRICIDRTWTQC